MIGFEPQYNIIPNIDPDRKLLGIARGEFVLQGDIVFLQLWSGENFPIEHVYFMSNAFNDLDGNLRYPKPSMFDDKGNRQQQGDFVMATFLDGDITNPVILGSILPNQLNSFFHKFTKDDYQKKKKRFETENCVIEYQDDADGEIQIDVTAQAQGSGNITLNLIGIGENGNITVNVTGTATIKANEKAIIDSPLIELGKDSTEKLVLGNSWAQLFKAHTHPTPAGPSGVPVNAAQADQCLSEQNTSL